MRKILAFLALLTPFVARAADNPKLVSPYVWIEVPDMPGFYAVPMHGEQAGDPVSSDVLFDGRTNTFLQLYASNDGNPLYFTRWDPDRVIYHVNGDYYTLLAENGQRVLPADIGPDRPGFGDLIAARKNFNARSEPPSREFFHEFFRHFELGFDPARSDLRWYEIRPRVYLNFESQTIWDARLKLLSRSFEALNANSPLRNLWRSRLREEPGLAVVEKATRVTGALERLIYVPTIDKYWVVERAEYFLPPTKIDPTRPWFPFLDEGPGLHLCVHHLQVDAAARKIFMPRSAR